MQIENIQRVAIDSIIAVDRPLNLTHTTEHLQFMMDSLASVGQLTPLCIQSDKTLFDGFARLLIMRELGFDSVLVSVRDHKDKLSLYEDVVMSNRGRDWSLSDYNEVFREFRKLYPKKQGAKSGEGKYDSSEKIAKLLGINARKLQRIEQIARFSPGLLDTVSKGEIDITLTDVHQIITQANANGIKEAKTMDDVLTVARKVLDLDESDDSPAEVLLTQMANKTRKDKAEKLAKAPPKQVTEPTFPYGLYCGTCFYNPDSLTYRCKK